ncbi:BTAD domain-containing putative transcriptional regulator [Streptomyces sp. N35]|uniref:BTAD domain-containing putative transcriptional regulator n=1 Tax=Streptomyces sp. N35 TaxID=2795730 RepID=UPI001F1B4B85|nr:BTAD domain-containing putative transcriptional regulator [Streptomyces sp. N35]
MRFEVLGSLGVRAGDGAAVAVPEAKVRALLAVLLVHAGQPVGVDRIVEDLWGASARPGNPANALQTKVSQLRRALEKGEPGARALVEYGPAGYRLGVTEEEVDAGRFGQLVARARQAGDPRIRVALLSDALRLWRGPAFDGFRDASFAQAAIARLEEQRITVQEELAGLRVELGEHGLLADELTDLVAEHPLREGLRAVQMRALYRSGRQSEALAAYLELSRHLADELGVDPGPELRELYEAMLRQDPHLAPTTAPAPSAPRPSTNLPARTDTVIGREPAVTRICALLATERLVTLTGPGGVGKTRLATEAAARLVPAASAPASATAAGAASAPASAPAPAPAPASRLVPGATAGSAASTTGQGLVASVAGLDPIASAPGLRPATSAAELARDASATKPSPAAFAPQSGHPPASAAQSDPPVSAAAPAPTTAPAPTPATAAQPWPQLPDGVWLVELAGARRDPVDAIAAALGIRDEPSAEPTPQPQPQPQPQPHLPPQSATNPTQRDTPSATQGDAPQTDRASRLLRALASRELLLVLDNCEHMVDAVAALVGRLLRAAPGVRVLATSQEPLNVSGETVEAVAPLEGPEAVALFVARAASAAPGFTLTAANRESVELICRRLDGIPLALELAATRVRALGVEALADRLHDRFRLLSQVRRDAPARQRTLRAMIDWSWELLGPPERAVLRRLAVFAGGFTLDAAEAVCAEPTLPLGPAPAHSLDPAPTLPLGPAPAPAPTPATRPHPDPTPDQQPTPEDILDLVARLVDRSLVTMTYDGQGARYRMLESVTAYSLEQLAASGEEQATRDRHARHYAELAERAAPLLHGGEQCTWLRRLDAESLNLHTALDRTRDPALALRIVNSLTWYWYLSGRLSEGLSHLNHALTTAEAQAHALTTAEAQAHALTTADVPHPCAPPTPPTLTAALTATRIRRAALALITGDASHQSDPFEGADARGRWLLAYARCGFTHLPDRGRLHALETEFRALGDAWGEAAALSTWATRSLYEGDLRSLREAAEAAAGRFTALGDRWGQAQATELLGVLAEITGDYPAAARLHGEGLRVAEELRLWTQASFSLSRLGRIALLTGEFDRATEYHEQAARLAADQGHAPARQFAEIGLALGARHRGDLDTAQSLLAPWLDWNRRLGVDSGTALLLAQSGYVAELRGDHELAESLHAEGLSAARRTGDARAIAFAVEGLAGAWSASGAAGRAAEALGTAGALRASVASPLPPGERTDVDRAAARARAALGADAYTAAYERGYKTPPADFTP